MFELKPDFEDVLNRYEAWWDCEIADRPLVSMSFPQPQARRVEVPIKEHKTLRERWMDTEHLVARTDARLRNTVYYADSLPVAWPNLGPEIFSAFYGCEMVYGESTAWSKPILADWSDKSLEALRLDKNAFYFRKVTEMTHAICSNPWIQEAYGSVPLQAYQTSRKRRRHCARSPGGQRGND